MILDFSITLNCWIQGSLLPPTYSTEDCWITLLSRVSKLKEDKPGTVSIQLDGWSANHHGYIGLLANYITKDWRRAKLCLACRPFDESHTGENLARWVENQTDNWGITDEVEVVTTDTASNMLKIMDYLPLHFRHGGCINPVLQLSIKDELFEKPSIKNLIKTCRHICTYANQAVAFSQLIISKQVEAGTEKRYCFLLLQDVVTRWNSTYTIKVSSSPACCPLYPAGSGVAEETECQHY